MVRPPLTSMLSPLTKSSSIRNLIASAICLGYGVGVDNVDLAAATRHGVQICNMPDYGMHEVSDHALALMMALIRKIPATVSHPRNRDWDFRKMAPNLLPIGLKQGHWAELPLTVLLRNRSTRNRVFSTWTMYS